MKEYMEIQRAVFGGEFLEPNVDSFKVGDIIHITEKLDGANTSATWDDGRVRCWCRKECTPMFTSRGFYNYIHRLNVDVFKSNQNYIVFGEWLVPHTITYTKDTYERWYVFDIWDKVEHQWLSKDDVELFCNKYGLEFVPILYKGPFISWDHCREFMNSPKYGQEQEGIVIFNLSAKERHERFALKLVNGRFKEIQKERHIKKVIDPQRLQEKEESKQLMETVVTEARVRKMLWKLIDEEVIPEKINPEDMSVVAKLLPIRVYNDCVKEANEVVEAAGKYAGKYCNYLTMNIVREIVFGEK